MKLITNNKYITKWRNNTMTNNEFIAMNEIAKHYNNISNTILNKKRFFLAFCKAVLKWYSDEKSNCYADEALYSKLTNSADIEYNAITDTVFVSYYTEDNEIIHFPTTEILKQINNTNKYDKLI